MQVICDFVSILKKVYFKKLVLEVSTHFWIMYASMFSTFTELSKSKRQKFWKSTYDRKIQPTSNKPALSK